MEFRRVLFRSADARKPARRSRSEQGGGTVMKAQYKLAGFASALAISLFAASASAEPTSMQNVMAVAIDSNPQIHQAEMNKQAIEFELEQAKGLYLPRITLEMSARSEEHTSELQSLMRISYAVFCLKKKK